MRRIAMIFLSALVVAGAAQAGGPAKVTPDADPAPPAAVLSDWTGFYAGISVGSGTFDQTDSAFGTDNTALHVGYLRDLGRMVLGAELAYATGGYENVTLSDWDSTRVKLIGGYDAGRFLPYGFVGRSTYDINAAMPYSDSMTIYGLGVKVAANDGFAFGLEYLVERKDMFAGTVDVKSDELMLRLDYRF